MGHGSIRKDCIGQTLKTLPNSKSDFWYFKNIEVLFVWVWSPSFYPFALTILFIMLSPKIDLFLTRPITNDFV